MKKQRKLELLIGSGCVVKGDIITKGSVTVEGVITGDIQAEGDICFTKTAQIDGSYAGRNIIMDGKGKGILKATSYIKMSSSADFVGDTYAVSLISDQGAKFMGRCYVLDNGESVTKKKVRRK